MLYPLECLVCYVMPALVCAGKLLDLVVHFAWQQVAKACVTGKPLLKLLQ